MKQIPILKNSWSSEKGEDFSSGGEKAKRRCYFIWILIDGKDLNMRQWETRESYGYFSLRKYIGTKTQRGES